MTPRLFEGQVDWQAVLLALSATLMIAWLFARVVKRLAARALQTIVGGTLATSSPLVRGPLRLLGAAAFLLVSSLLLFPAFELAGLRPRAGVPLQSVGAWAFAHGFRILIVIVLAYALIRSTGLLVKRFEHDVTQGTTADALERAKRARTLGSVVGRVATVCVSSLAALMVLNELGVNITPVLTGAGIAGLAVGFGAQTLVRDIISGFFLILEDQVRVGDGVVINGTSGLVEELNLRTIVLRDDEGTVHVFPNGSITTLANRSKDFSYYVISLGIPYGEDSDRVAEIVRGVGADMQKDPRFEPFILEPVEIIGVDSFSDWAVLFKFRIKTVAQRQGEIGREFRKRVRKALDAHGVQVPFPERIVTVRHAPPDAPERQ
jgi:small-conductance mechanosensitive channel